MSSSSTLFNFVEMFVDVYTSTSKNKYTANVPILVQNLEPLTPGSFEPSIPIPLVP